MNILLNNDKNGRLYETACEYGIVVSEIAFLVNDADAAHKRALSLGAENINLLVDRQKVIFLLFGAGQIVL